MLSSEVQPFSLSWENHPRQLPPWREGLESVSQGCFQTQSPARGGAKQLSYIPSLRVSPHPLVRGVTSRRAQSLISEYLLLFIIFIFSPCLCVYPTHTALSRTLRQKPCNPEETAPGQALLPSYQGQQLRLLGAERNQTTIFTPGADTRAW